MDKANRVILNKCDLALLVYAFIGAIPTGAVAQDLHVMADTLFQPALKDLVPMFTERTGSGIRLALGPSTILAERIFAGDPVDVFFPAGERHMRQALEKGRVDVTLKRNILILSNSTLSDPTDDHGPEYASAAVIIPSDQRVQAMAFLEFLVSEAAREVFARHGFGLP